MIRHVMHTLMILPAVLLTCAPALSQNAVPLPDLDSRRLLNDLHVTVASTPHLGDGMTIGLLVRYGSTFDPEDKGGLAQLVSRMFMGATADKSAQGIREELAYLNATLDIQCDWDGIRFLLNGQSSKYERSLLLLYQVVGEAVFTEADFNSVKSSTLQDIQKAPDPRYRIHYQLDNVLFAGTTYGRPIAGTQRSVSAITIGDIRYFYKRFFSPSQASLLIVGNVDASQVLQRAARIWGVWVRKDDVPFTFRSPMKPAGRQIYLEDDPGSPAAQFIMGNLFPQRGDPMYGSATLVARILQERLTKLLPTSLITVGYEGRRMSSPFYVQGQAASDQTLENIQKIEGAAEALREGGVSKEELEAAQRQVIEEFNRELGTTGGICKIVLDSELYRLGSNYAAAFPDQIRRFDAESIKNAANNWIFPSGEIILIRGPAATLKPALSPLGPPRQLSP